MVVDHIGYSVYNIDKAKKFLEVLGYSFEKTIEDSERGIYIAFGDSENGKFRIELVSPTGKKDSPVDKHLSKIGPTPYHLCFSSDDLDSDIEKLKTNGFKIIIPPAPAIAFDGNRVVFMYSLSVGIIEIVENHSA